MVSGVKVLKLSSSGVWQKKILTVSREGLSVTNPNTGNTLQDVPIALVWVSDDKGKSLGQMEKVRAWGRGGTVFSRSLQITHF